MHKNCPIFMKSNSLGEAAHPDPYGGCGEILQFLIILINYMELKKLVLCSLYMR